MAKLTKNQFLDQLKDPEVASIQRTISAIRKAIRPLGWRIQAHNNKKDKCFEIIAIPRDDQPLLTLLSILKNATAIKEEVDYRDNFDDVWDLMIDISHAELKGTPPTLSIDGGELIEAHIPYHRLKA